MAPVGPVDLDELRLVLAPRLRDVTEPPPRRRYGAVYVAPARAVRGMAFDVVFVPGLAENLFPGAIVEDPVLLDGQRRTLDAELPVEADRVAGERLALRLAVGAATTRVFLSYPRVDVERARPRVPSFYALEALQATEGTLPGFDELTARAMHETPARLGWPAPVRADDAVDEAEYDLALLAPLLDADEATTLGTAHYLLDANPHLARALRTRARRWIKRWTAADGLVDPEAFALEALARHQLDKRSFSPTALQLFAACPYRFFLQAIHRLQPREDPVAIEVMDPLTRGGLFHDVQFGVLMRLRGQRRLPLRTETLAAANDVLDEILSVEAKKLEEKLHPAIPRVWQDGIESLRVDLREWLRRQVDDPEGWVPSRFELAFGLPAGDREYLDPESRREPVQVTPALSLRGSIDLVERHPHGGLRATDHKTGKVWAKEGVVVGGGKVLQPVLYALVCEQMLGAPVESGRLYYCTSAGAYTERVVPLDARARGYVDEIVRIMGEALRQGFLPAAPEAGACTYCDYRPVCGPHEELRTGRKPRERLSALTRVRDMP
jgi:ATP-dependent helicase/DNAse subunit B